MNRLLSIMIPLLFINNSHAQIIVQKDSLIQQMVNEVSADSIKSYIFKLVGFGTRHTLSTQTSQDKGIGAARNWVLSKFNDFAKNSGGRLHAFIDTVTLPP